MSDVATVARNDFRSVRRSRLLWLIVAVYVGLMVLLFLSNSSLYADTVSGEVSVTYTLGAAIWITALVLPLVAITAAYLAVAGERESNTVRFLLSQPTSRRAVVLGKFCSRGAALAVGLLFALLATVLVVVAFYPALDAGALATFFALSALLVAAYASLAVGVSAAVDTRSRAIGGTLTAYFLTVMLSVFPQFSIEAALQRLLGDGLGLGGGDHAYRFLGAVLSPASAYFDATLQYLPLGGSNTIPPDAPVYLSAEALTLVLVAWVVVPLAVGVSVFEAAEIG